MAEVLNKEDKTPLYNQLAEILKDDIKNFSSGSRFYADRELCRKFQVSQPVVRSALSILARDGYIERVMSKGTFVKERSKTDKLIKNKTIAVLSILESGFPHINAIRAIENETQKIGFDIILGQNNDVESRGIEFMVEKIRHYLDKTDGIIWVSPITCEVMPVPAFFKEHAQRLVFINTLMNHPSLSCVIADYEAGAANATEHLISLGYKNIGYIGGSKSRMIGHMRWRGFQKSIQAYNLPSEAPYIFPFTDDYSFEEGQKVIKEILKKGQLPEAIFCVTSEVAFGVMTVLKEHNLRVPEDIAIVGVDDKSIYEKLHLTTVKRPYFEMGEVAIKQLLQQLYGRQSSGIKQYVPCDLIIRESCGCKIVTEKGGVDEK